MGVDLRQRLAINAINSRANSVLGSSKPSIAYPSEIAQYQMIYPSIVHRSARADLPRHATNVAILTISFHVNTVVTSAVSDDRIRCCHRDIRTRAVKAD